jgi:putative ATPase
MNLADAPRFDRIVGRNLLTRAVDRSAVLASLAGCLRPGGRIVLAETVPKRTQRLYHLIDPTALDRDLFSQLVEAEEAIYTDPHDPLVNWDVADLEGSGTASGLRVQVQLAVNCGELQVTPQVIGRWFGSGEGGKPSYAARLAAHGLTAEQVARIRECFTRLRSVPWESTVAFVEAEQKN